MNKIIGSLSIIVSIAIYSTAADGANTSLSLCKGAYSPDIGMIQFAAFDACTNAIRDGQQQAGMYSCDENENVILKQWIGNNCNGIPDLEQTVNYLFIGMNIICNGRDCEYAKVRTYDNTNCKSSGDYIEQAYSVNQCISGNNSFSQWSTQSICTDTIYETEYYDNDDCSGNISTSISFTGMFYAEDGECNDDNSYQEVTGCNLMSADKANEFELYAVFVALISMLSYFLW
eukprot:818439_1